MHAWLWGKSPRRTSAAGLRGQYSALLAGSTENAASRFDLTRATWVRTDGVPLADSAAELAAGRTKASLSMTLDGMNVTAQTMWTGSVSETPDGAASNPATCQDWTTVGSAVGGVAQPTYAGTWAFGYGVTISCSQPVEHLYCLER